MLTLSTQVFSEDAREAYSNLEKKKTKLKFSFSCFDLV